MKFLGTDLTYSSPSIFFLFFFPIFCNFDPIKMTKSAIGGKKHFEDPVAAFMVTTVLTSSF